MLFDLSSDYTCSDDDGIDPPQHHLQPSDSGPGQTSDNCLSPTNSDDPGVTSPFPGLPYTGVSHFSLALSIYYPFT